MNLPITPKRVATEFSKVLRSHLTPEQMDKVIKRNRTRKYPSVCHSHDFCDANMAMLEAFGNVGIDASIDEEKDEAHAEAVTKIWNEAWDIAKASEFDATDPYEKAKAILDDVIYDGLNDMYRRLQNEMGVTTGDEASIYHASYGEELRETLECFFKKYIDFEKKMEQGSRKE